jgi:UDP-GlcNAc:undecaprenyl-phosphate GlcNAc-1-phosphate transferase
VLVSALIVDPRLALAVHFWVSAFIVFITGFIDDRIPIRARYRLLAQFSAAAFFMLSSGATLAHLGELIGPFPIELGVFALPFAVIGIAGLTNASNMTDGLDGLAGGLSCIAFGWLLLVFALISRDVVETGPEFAERALQVSKVASLLFGALLAFLVFNQRSPWRRRASMFLGDGGSMALGFLVAAMLVYACGAFGSAGMPAVAAVWIAAVPLIDIFSSMLRRVLVGVTPMTPDRRHLHHLLLARGMSTESAVLTLQGLAVVSGLVGVAGWRWGVPDYVLFWLLAAVFVAYFALSQRFWHRMDALEVGPFMAGAPMGTSAQVVSSVQAAQQSAQVAPISSAPSGTLDTAVLSPTQTGTNG